MGHRLTASEFEIRVKEKHQSIVQIGAYVDYHTKIEFMCLKCGRHWYTMPSYVLNGHGCNCHQAKTHDEFVAEVRQINKNISVIGEYSGSREKIEMMCNIDGHHWMAFPDNILHGQGCPVCFNHGRTKTHENFIKEVQANNSDIFVVGEYTGASRRVKVKCLKCGHEWNPIADSVLKFGCQKCAGLYQNHDDFIRKLSEFNKDIIVLGHYKNNHTNIKLKCLKCGNVWYAKPQNVLSGTGCPQCVQPRGERAVKQYLRNNHIGYIEQYKFEDCKNIHPLPFDFFCPDLGIAIEYDGIQHYQAVERFGGKEGLRETQFRDSIKSAYCQSNNIPLLRISYTEYKNISLIIDSFISSLEKTA